MRLVVVLALSWAAARWRTCKRCLRKPRVWQRCSVPTLRNASALLLRVNAVRLLRWRRLIRLERSAGGVGATAHTDRFFLSIFRSHTLRAHTVLRAQAEHSELQRALRAAPLDAYRAVVKAEEAARQQANAGDADVRVVRPTL